MVHAAISGQQAMRGVQGSWHTGSAVEKPVKSPMMVATGQKH
jgi:hypothetical protein